MADDNNTSGSEELTLNTQQASRSLGQLIKQAEKLKSELMRAGNFKAEGFDQAASQAKAAGKEISNILAAYSAALSNLPTKFAQATQRINASIDRTGTALGQQANQYRRAASLVKDAYSLLQSDKKLDTPIKTARDAAELYRKKLKEVARAIAEVDRTGAYAGRNEAQQRLVVQLDQARREAAELLLIQKQLTTEENLTTAAKKRTIKAVDELNELQVRGLRRVEAMQREAAREAAAAAREQRLAASTGAIAGGTGRSLTQRFTTQARTFTNYAVLGTAFVGAGAVAREVVALDNALHNLQAITQSSDSSILKLREDILGVSSATKFFASDLADAATVLAQAGLSTTEVAAALKSVAIFAQATGIELKESVDLMTSAMGAFHLQASETENIANLFTAALNKSKLNVQQLSVGFQYAATSAAQLGIPIAELTTAMALMANAGIRSGSIIGTGLRQVLNQISAPSTKFQQVLRSLGVTMNDIDLQSHGLINVLTTLSEHGFGASEAFRAFGTRGAGAYIALTSQIGNAYKLQESLIGTKAATEAAETQMKSLTNTAKNFGAAIAALASNAFQPLVFAFTAVIAGGTKFVHMLEYLGPLVSVAATAIGVFGTIKAVQYIAGVIGMTTATGAFTAALDAEVIALTAIDVLLSPMTAVVTALTIAIVGTSIALNAATQAHQAHAAAVEVSRGKVETLQAQYGSLLTETQNLITKEGDLTTRKGELAVVAEQLGERFKSLGLNTVGLGVDVRNLTSDYETLLQRMGSARLLNLNLQSGAIAELRRGLVKQNADERYDAARLSGANLRQQVQQAGGNIHAAIPGISTPGLDAFLRYRTARGAAPIGTNDLNSLGAASRELALINTSKLTDRQLRVVEAFQNLIEKANEAAVKVTKSGNEIAQHDIELKALRLQTGGNFTKFAGSTQNFIAQAKRGLPIDTGIDDVGYEKAISAYAEKVHNQVETLKKALAGYSKSDPAHKAAVDQSGLFVQLLQLESDLKTRTDGALRKAKAQLEKTGELSAQLVEHQITNANKELSRSKTSADAQAATSKIRELVGRQFKAEVDKLAANTLNLSPSQYTTKDGKVVLKPGIDKQLNETQKTDIKILEDKYASNLEGHNDDLAAKLDSLAQRTTSRLTSNTVKAVNNDLQTIATTMKAALDGIAVELKSVTKQSTPEEVKTHLDNALKLLDEWYALKIEELNDQIKKAKARGVRLTPDQISARQQALLDEFNAKQFTIQTGFNAKGATITGGQLQNTITTLGLQIKSVLSKITAELKSIDQYTPISEVRKSIAEALKAIQEWYDLQFAKLTAEIAKANEIGFPLTAADIQARQDALKSELESRRDEISNKGEDALNTKAGRLPATWQDAFEGIRSAAEDPRKTKSEAQINEFALTFQDTMISAVEAVRQNFGQMWSDVVSGAKSAGQAFKDFAKSILSSMLSTISNRIAQQFLDLIFGSKGGSTGGGFGGLLSSIFGSSASAGSAGLGSGLASAGAGLASGGLVRGAVRGRDSVRTRVPRGTFIMRQSAVSRLGTGFLDHINHTVPVRLTPGEYGINPGAARAFGMGNLRRLNAQGNTYSREGLYAGGGPVMGSTLHGMDAHGRAVLDPFGGKLKMPSQKKNDVTTNVWLVKPDDVPQMGPNDVLAVFAGDIARNGPTKKLIKSIVMGN